MITLVAQGGVDDQFTTSVVDQTVIDSAGEFMVVFPGSTNTGDDKGEKGIGSPIVANRILVFSTFLPDAQLENSCSAGPGIGNLFTLDYLTGRPALARLPGSDALLAGQTDNQKADAAGMSVGVGLPSPASLTFGDRGSLVMTVAFTGSEAGNTGSQYLVLEIADFPQRTQTLYWEEII